MFLFIKFLFLCLVGLAACFGEKDYPVFSSEYRLTGFILLPYAEITEPFTAYYSGEANKSRIDYYGDLMLTVQRGDENSLYKIVYMTDNNDIPQRTCVKVPDGTIQNLFPDLSTFKKTASAPCKASNNMRSKIFGDQICEVWTYVETIGQKKNTYTFILRHDDQGYPVPIVYLMAGYDSLLGSHYDEYEVVYRQYTPGPVDQSIYDIAKDYTCGDFPGPGNRISMNPMHEFIHGSNRIEEHFGEFQKTHGKAYQDEKEAAYRSKIFTTNLRLIESKNRGLKHFNLAVNHLADRSDEELRILRGRKRTEGYNGGLGFDISLYELDKVPESFDWHILGAVTPVKDQAICGSCWSFGTTGTIEGVNFVKTGNLVTLSEQQLVDCSWTEANNGCDGGEDFRAYDYIMKNGGIALTEDYGEYLGVDGKCHDKDVKKAIQLKGFVNVTSGSAEALEAAIFYNGPVTVAIDASPKTFTFYSHGVYNDPVCSNTELDHQVLAVGYGSIKGEKYWIIKNSWSTHYGTDGYVLIAQKDNVCGVMNEPTYPIIARKNYKF